MFKEYIDILAKCLKDTIQKMSNADIAGVQVKQEEHQSANYSVANIIQYEDFENKIKGDFSLGFTDEKMAVSVSSAIAQKMGLPPITKVDETAADILNEFINIAVGNTTSEWEKRGHNCRFSNPTLVRDQSASTSVAPYTESYQIVLNPAADQIIKNNVIFKTTFTWFDGQQMGKRILLAEDSKTMMMILVKTLEEAGYHVEQAKDGLEATKKHKAFQPDLTIMDLIMPEMGGLDAILKIRESAPNAKFLILTATSRIDEVVTAKTLKVVDYIIKPAEPEDLLAKVKKALE